MNKLIKRYIFGFKLPQYLSNGELLNKELIIINCPRFLCVPCYLCQFIDMGSYLNIEFNIVLSDLKQRSLTLNLGLK